MGAFAKLKALSFELKAIKRSRGTDFRTSRLSDSPPAKNQTYPTTSTML